MHCLKFSVLWNFLGLKLVPVCNSKSANYAQPQRKSLHKTMHILNVSEYDVGTTEQMFCIWNKNYRVWEYLALYGFLTVQPWTAWCQVCSGTKIAAVVSHECWATASVSSREVYIHPLPPGKGRGPARGYFDLHWRVKQPHVGPCFFPCKTFLHHTVLVYLPPHPTVLLPSALWLALSQHRLTLSHLQCWAGTDCCRYVLCHVCVSVHMQWASASLT